MQADDESNEIMKQIIDKENRLRERIKNSGHGDEFNKMMQKGFDEDDRIRQSVKSAGYCKYCKDKGEVAEIDHLGRREEYWCKYCDKGRIGNEISEKEFKLKYPHLKAYEL